MAQGVLRIEGLPKGALDAAAAFHAEWLMKARALLDPPHARKDLVIVFPAAPFDHRGWRLAAVQDLARASAAQRINAVSGDDERAIEETIAWLATAPGVTGQVLEVGCD